MKVTDPVALIEAAYRLDGTDASWLKELARAATVALRGEQGAFAFLYDATAGDWIHILGVEMHELHIPTGFDRRSDGIRSRFRNHPIRIPEHPIGDSEDSISVPEHPIKSAGRLTGRARMVAAHEATDHAQGSRSSPSSLRVRLQAPSDLRRLRRVTLDSY